LGSLCPVSPAPRESCANLAGLRVDSRLVVLREPYDLKMRSWVGVRALLLVALTAMLASGGGGVARAATGLTLSVTPNPILTGEGVLVYGRLSGPGHGAAKIVLHDEVSPATTFGVEAAATTDASGFYEFVLPVGAVATNRSWYVSAPGGSRSRTVHERVAATLTLAASAVTGDTSHALSFSGQVAPAVHAGEQVSLQKATGTIGGSWTTIGHALIDASSSFAISHDFHTPGAYELRVVFAGDAQSSKASSDPVTVVSQQADHPTFTIYTSNPVINAGQSVTIAGRLSAPSSPSRPLAGQSVTLWGHPRGATFASLASTTTGSDGSYQFTQMPSSDGSYEVRTTGRQTAPLYEAVRAVLTLVASTTSSTVGESVNLSGSVTPNQGGGAVDLEQLGSDGHFHVVQSATVDASSAFAFMVKFGSPGTHIYRAVAPGSAANASGASGPVAIVVALPPVEALPTLCVACVNPITLPVPPAPAATVVTVTAGLPMAYAFRLSTAAQPKVISDKPATELTVPLGDVTFNVTDAAGGILSHTFEVCTTPLPGPVTTLAAIQKLPNSCSGTTAPPSPKVLAPGEAATMTIHFAASGSYEYLSTVGGAATGDAFAGMKGVLTIT
jgi:hypothetical protein